MPARNQDPRAIHPLLAAASYNDARAMFNAGRVNGDDIRAWFPVWCVGKFEYGMHEGCACERTPDGHWRPLAWIVNA